MKCHSEKGPIGMELLLNKILEDETNQWNGSESVTRLESLCCVTYICRINKLGSTGGTDSVTFEAIPMAKLTGILFFASLGIMADRKLSSHRLILSSSAGL